ncbi:SLBB domain-containing protein [Telmatocola sphagniphila]|uniref:SLBB domain-containing protein n=1 Tax=Telmatocola sphagniphila TaxID=1123043 RepID=A0A8E6B6A3_9BACT|nr:SLBB domain-containing protein [Telmatocola sphagniphila]QVL31956.1 SLBB domain-containing protein [Telmatocola sphagniphila]
MRFSSKIRCYFLVGALLIGCCMPGCASRQAQVRKIISQPIPQKEYSPQLDALAYQVAFPDRLNLEVEGRPELNGNHLIAVDGKLQLRDQQIPVENESLAEVRKQLSQLFNVPVEKIQVRVAAHQSKVLLIHGAVAGGTRHIDYRGPETVLEVLERAGGLTIDADLQQIYLVRSNVINGGKQEVIDIELEKILIDHDTKSNILVRPNDEIYVGENRRANWAKILPPFMMPIYHKVSSWIPGLNSTKTNSPEEKH